MNERVLHLTPHLNGGLGKVLVSTLQYFNRIAPSHYVLVYEEAALLPDEFLIHQNCIFFVTDTADISNKLLSFDLIQVEYWNHPLIYKLLCSGILDKVRVIGCAHIQGESPPQLITSESIRYFEMFLMTGVCSEKFLLESKQDINKLREIRFPLDLSKFQYFDRSLKDPSLPIVLGYVGTLSYAKLHKKFLKICSELNQSIKLIIVGSDEGGCLKREATKDYPNLAAEFLGFRTDISEILKTIDIFVYPLRDGHYGTGELALVEALHSGAATIAFKNPAEQRLIVDGVTGLLAVDEDDFVSKLSRLCEDKSLRLKLGANANRNIVDWYSAEKCFEDIENCYIEFSMKRLTSSDAFKNSYRCLAAEYADDFQEGFRLFLESMRDADETYKIFLNYFKVRSSGEALIIDQAEDVMLDFFRSNPGFEYTSKGGLGHYLHVFPGDTYLELLHCLVRRTVGEQS